MSANDYLLQWPSLIDISANRVASIEITDTTLAHRVIVDLSLNDVSGCFGYVRAYNWTDPIGFWRSGTVAGLFDKVAARVKKDFDDTDALDFTTTALDANFRRNTANDFVTPYVLFRLFGDSGVASTTVPNYANLVTNPSNDPLLPSASFTAAFVAVIRTATTGLDVSGATFDANTMFKQLLNDTGRFTNNGTPVVALYSPDPWTGALVSNVGPNAWRLQNGDITQFTVRFTFQNQIRVKGFTSITTDANNTGTPPESTVKVIPAGETFTIRLQLRVN